MKHPDRWTARSLLLAVAVLPVLTPDPNQPMGPLLAAVSWLALACAAWLVLLMGLSWLSHRRLRAVSWLARWLCARLAPASVRQVVALAVGGSLVLGSAPALAAGAPQLSASAPAPAAPASLDWPRQGVGPVTAEPLTAPTQAAGPTALPSSDPVAEPAADDSSVAPVPEPASEPTTVIDPAGADPVIASDPILHVVVRQVDSLWRIAAASLGDGATDAKVARAWPLWWQANRRLIGDDPDLIRVGTTLTAPALPTSH